MIELTLCWGDHAFDEIFVGSIADEQRHASRAGTAKKPVERLSMTTTLAPASTNAAITVWLPIYPAPPVTRHCHDFQTCISARSVRRA